MDQHSHTLTHYFVLTLLTYFKTNNKINRCGRQLPRQLTFNFLQQFSNVSFEPPFQSYILHLLLQSLDGTLVVRALYCFFFFFVINCWDPAFIRHSLDPGMEVQVIQGHPRIEKTARTEPAVKHCEWQEFRRKL